MWVCVAPMLSTSAIFLFADHSLEGRVSSLVLPRISLLCLDRRLSLCISTPLTLSIDLGEPGVGFAGGRGAEDNLITSTGIGQADLDSEIVCDWIERRGLASVG